MKIKDMKIAVERAKFGLFFLNKKKEFLSENINVFENFVEKLENELNVLENETHIKLKSQMINDVNNDIYQMKDNLENTVKQIEKITTFTNEIIENENNHKYFEERENILRAFDYLDEFTDEELTVMNNYGWVRENEKAN